jgi:hypothetical protein
MKTITQWNTLAITKATTLNADAVAHGIKASDELKDFSRAVERELHTENRQTLAIAIFRGSEDRLQAASLLKAAWDAILANTARACSAVGRVAAVADWATFSLAATPIRLWQGEAKTAITPHTIVELINALKTEPELLEQLKVQGKNLCSAPSLKGAATWVLTEHAFVLKHLEESVRDSGRFQKPEHTLVIADGTKVNAYAWAQLQALYNPEIAKAGDLAKGLASLAKFAAQQSVTHAHFSKVASTAFWVVEGFAPRGRLGNGERVSGITKAGVVISTTGVDAMHDVQAEDSNYYGAEPVVMRAPFWGSKTLGVNLTADEVAEAISDTQGEFEDVADTLLTIAREVDARLGAGGDRYYVKGMGETTLGAVLSEAQAKLDAKQAEFVATVAASLKRRLLDKARNVLAQASGFNAAQKAQYVKAACTAIDGLKDAFKELRTVAKQEAVALLTLEVTKSHTVALVADAAYAENLAVAVEAARLERKAANDAKRANEMVAVAVLEAELVAARAIEAAKGGRV